MLGACAAPAPPDTTEDVAAEDMAAGTLTIASTQDIDNYDPHWNQLIAYNVLVGHNIFDSLTRLDANMNIVPALASSWDISEDGTEYTFHLRSGSQFHNGRELAADDVVFSFNQPTEQETIYANTMDPVVSVEAVDNTTVKFTLTAYWAPFLEDISLIAIVAEETIDTISDTPRAGVLSVPPALSASRPAPHTQSDSCRPSDGAVPAAPL